MQVRFFYDNSKQRLVSSLRTQTVKRTLKNTTIKDTLKEWNYRRLDRGAIAARKWPGMGLET